MNEENVVYNIYNDKWYAIEYAIKENEIMLGAGGSRL
jgi:hypothetical protein